MYLIVEKEASYLCLLAILTLGLQRVFLYTAEQTMDSAPAKL